MKSYKVRTGHNSGKLAKVLFYSHQFTLMCVNRIRHGGKTPEPDDILLLHYINRPAITYVYNMTTKLTRVHLYFICYINVGVSDVNIMPSNHCFQSIDRSINQTINQSVYHLTSHPTNQLTNQSRYQPINQLSNQSIDQSVRQSLTFLLKEQNMSN